MDFYRMNLECCRVARVYQPQLSFLVYIMFLGLSCLDFFARGLHTRTAVVCLP